MENPIHNAADENQREARKYKWCEGNLGKYWNRETAQNQRPAEARNGTHARPSLRLLGSFCRRTNEGKRNAPRNPDARPENGSEEIQSPSQ
jgi:hypothetical protein